ncbi:hypothetical protein TNCV_3733391 [Trichonephila clavipes]|nr:hypothetical protein TNCV_3733391 [Trichonephila clavipes]
MIFLCGLSVPQAALTTCIESKQILEDASMDLRNENQLFRAKSKVKNLNFEVDEHKESLEHVDSFKGLRSWLE